MVEVRSTRSKIRRWIVNVFYYTFKILGLVPFSMQTETSSDEYRPWSKTVFVYSKPGLAYNILIAIITCVVNFVSIRSWYIIANENDYVPSTYYLHSITLLTRVIGTIIAIGLWTIEQEKTVHILNRLSETDGLLRCLKHRGFDKRIITPFAISMIVAVTRFCSPFILASVQMDLFFGSHPYINSLLIELPFTIMYCFHIQYLLFLGPVVVNLDRVNEGLSCFTEFQNPSRLRPPFADYLTVFLLRSNQRSELAALRSLRAIRNSLIELSREIEELFAFPILILIAANFVYILNEIFDLVYYNIFAEAPTVLVDVLALVLATVQVFQPLISLLDIIRQMKDKAQLTAGIIDRAIAESIDREIIAELEDFSLQLLGEEVEFTACGLFPLENKILHSILATIATYLLVLCQAGVESTDMSIRQIN